MENAEHTLFVCARWSAEREAVGWAVGAELTPDIRHPGDEDEGARWACRATATGVSRNRIGACTRGPAYRADSAVRIDRGRNLLIPPLIGAASRLA